MGRRILTQREMSRLSDTDVGLMSKYLRGIKKPSLVVAKRVAETCNVPMEIFLEIEVQKQFFGKSFLEEDVDINQRKIRKWNVNEK